MILVPKMVSRHDQEQKQCFNTSMYHGILSSVLFYNPFLWMGWGWLIALHIWVLQDKARKATGMQVDAVEDYVDHELFSLASMKVCFNLFTSSISNQVLVF